jgi:hypothetical protein
VCCCSGYCEAPKADDLGADLIDPSSFLSTPFASQPIFIAGCASLIEWRGNGAGPVEEIDARSPSANRHFLFGLAAQRSFFVCREALSRMQKTWRGVSWLCSTLESKAAQEADVNLAQEGSAKVATRDVGYVKRVLEMFESESQDAGNLEKWAEQPECKLVVVLPMFLKKLALD